MTLRPGVTFSNGAPLTAQTIADMFPIQQTGATAAAAIAGAAWSRAPDGVRVRRGLTWMVDSERLIEAGGSAGISEPATQWYSP